MRYKAVNGTALWKSIQDIDARLSCQVSLNQQTGRSTAKSEKSTRLRQRVMTSESSAKQTLEEASRLALFKRPVLKHRFNPQHDKETIRAVVFLHDNAHIVSGSEKGTMHKWSCDTGLVVGKPWKCEGGGIYALALSPDGKMIGCGSEDGSIQRWTTDGEMIEGVWTGHSKAVQSLSWSPSGSHIASGSDDGTILIRKAESGEVEVGPIETKQEGVQVLAYSPSGEIIASGGFSTICFWNAITGEVVVGPTKGLGETVMSLVWSSDNTKLYSAAGSIARVFDSKSGELLNSFQSEHDDFLSSIALSPQQNVLACVGNNGIAQLWDTKFNQPLQVHQQFNREPHSGWLTCVSFSRDGKYIAYSGENGKLALWVLEAIAQENQPNSSESSSLCLNADATASDSFVEEAHDDPYHNFFQSSLQSIPSSSPGSHLLNLFSARRFLSVFSRRRVPPDDSESVPQEHSKRKFFARRARSDLSLESATMKPNQPMREGDVREGEDKQGVNVDADDRGSGNDPLSDKKDIDEQWNDDSPADAQSLPSDDTIPPTELDSADNRNIWKRLIRSRGVRKDPASVEIAPTIKRPEVVEVYAVRGFKRLVVMKRKRKTKLPEATCNIPLVAQNTSGSSPAGQLSQALGAPPAAAHFGGSLSLHTVPVQAGISSHAVGGNGSPIVSAIGGLHASPSHFVTNYHTSHDSDSRSSVEGSCNRFLDRICFPRGHYHEDS